MWDAVIIGGGAAGLFCAIQAGKRGRRVVVIEHSARVGRKIEISGGGRCNFTNINTTPESFLSANPHFCKSALARYTPADFVSLVKKHHISFYEKKLGQLFCHGSAQQIIDMLLLECSDAGVEIKCDCQVSNVAKKSEFQVKTSCGEFSSASLVIATGGLSIAPLGATDFGYRVAQQFDLRLEKPRPGLVPFTLEGELRKRMEKLSGISVDGLVSCAGEKFRENVLVTHRGLSGPAVLQASSYWTPGGAVVIDLLPDENILDVLLTQQYSDVELANLLAQFIPRRFAHAWCELYAPSKPLKQYGKRELEQVAAQLTNWKLIPSGTEGFKKAEVTAGGVATTELSSKSMESRKVPGLFFIGEVVDVTGHLGGYNFQWAWSSAAAAGAYI